VHRGANFDEAFLDLFEVFVQAEIENVTDRDVVEIGV
jgi:hypothetical protein